MRGNGDDGKGFLAVAAAAAATSRNFTHTKLAQGKEGGRHNPHSLPCLRRRRRRRCCCCCRQKRLMLRAFANYAVVVGRVLSAPNATASCTRRQRPPQRRLTPPGPHNDRSRARCCRDTRQRRRALTNRTRPAIEPAARPLHSSGPHAPLLGQARACRLSIGQKESCFQLQAPADHHLYLLLVIIRITIGWTLWFTIRFFLLPNS